jgi:hypothetical protein
VRHLLGVDVLYGGADAGRTQRTEQECDLVVFDKLSGLLDCFVRTIGIVVGSEVYLPAINAAAIVDRADVSDQTLPVLLSGDAGPLKGNVAPILISIFVTPGISARACAPAIVTPIAAASMDFLNIDFPLVRRRIASLIIR